MIGEVEEHLPKIAHKKNICPNRLNSEWLEYQQHLEFVEIDDSKLVDYENSADPKDAPFVILAEMLSVSGVMSNDPHIEQLGGKRIKLDIRVSLRDYSRKSAISLSIRLGGFAFSCASIGLFIALTKMLNKSLQAIYKIPNNYKIILLIAILIVFLTPSIRAKVLKFLHSTKSFFGESWAALAPVIDELILEASENGKQADLKLKEIHSHLTQYS